METGIDFVQSLQSDVAVNILACLNDPADVVHAGSVSRLWHHFVITNGLSKQLCMRRFPQLSRIARISKPDWITTEEANGFGSKNTSWDILKRDHNVYASLLQAMTTLNSSQSECIGYAVSASSTDRFPSESIVNTLTTRDRYLNRPSYWSSKGHADPDAAETLIYKLKADLCVITEINVQPFEAYFQTGKPIYSAKSVRFRLGHPKISDENDILQVPQEQPADETSSYGRIPQKYTLWYRKTAYNSSSYQNRYFALVDICRLNCWVEFRDNKRMTCFTYAFAM